MRYASPLAFLVLLIPQDAHAESCVGLSTNADKIACLIAAVDTLAAENVELSERLEAVESDYAANSAVVNLRGRVSVLESDSAAYVTSSELSSYALYDELVAAEEAIAAIEADYLTSGDVATEEISALFSYLSVDTGTDEVIFSGANIYVQSGEGSTDDNCDYYDETTGTYSGACSQTLTGLGNLIIGYNEDYTGDRDRTGSHNLVIGADHSYSSYGGLVSGFSNTISAQYATVSAGRDNTASAEFSVVSGGSGNTAQASYSVVTGGGDNVARGSLSVVSGGAYNTATNDYAVVSGGYENTASGYAAVVSGGYQNAASGTVSAVSGGSENTASGDFSVVYAGDSNTASSEGSYAP